MMAGIVYLVVGPTSFFVGLATTEVCALLSGYITKEGMPMGKKAVGFIKERAIEAWKRHFPLSRVTLLTSP
jgi:hypothetical protein